MRFPPLRITGTGFAAAIGGGLAGVLLSMLTLKHPPLTLAMGFVAPLPIMIAGLGFGPLAGLIAVAVGAGFVGLFDMRLGHLALTGLRSPSAAGLDVLVFLIALGLPAWLLSAAGRRAPVVATTPKARPEEQLLGRIAIIAVVFAALSISVVFAIAISANGGFDAFNTLMTATFDKIWQAIAERRPLPKGIDGSQFATQLIWLMPPLMSAAAVIFYVSNLWLAARIAQTSDLLGMPWPDIPRHMRLPRVAALALAITSGLSFTGGMLGLVSRVVSAALIAAFALQGLAVVHAVSRGKGSRTAALIIVYLSMAALMPWPLLLWGTLGLLDTAFFFRDRQKPALIRKS